MHNIEIYNVNAEDDVLESGKGLHGEKKAFFDSVKDKLKKAYIDYDDKAINGNLVSLSPLWILGQDDTNRNKAYNLYWSGRSLVKKHWENLERQNGGESILCPICGLTIAKEMDHYVPREKMPEFSVHRYNLIPLCHDCNHDKSAGWLDDNGHRCFFNAFFDKGLQDKLVECIISLSPKDNQPCIEIKINNSLDMTKEINNLVVSTIKRLNLLEKFKKRRKCVFGRDFKIFGDAMNIFAMRRRLKTFGKTRKKTTSIVRPITKQILYIIQLVKLYIIPMILKFGLKHCNFVIAL